MSGVGLRRFPALTWQITWYEGHRHLSHSVRQDYVHKTVDDTDLLVTAGLRADERHQSTYANQWLRKTYVCQPVRVNGLPMSTSGCDGT